ncbi:2-C-methyl-D-erythritol 4-phosphate cytidylyltransferase [Paenalkalicoccus suaedae]|uniref:2-C-methyl-D-erythritol 4-phosphate cytidylyltransferase n=1 Tax=Paenalkalicoccus suaedae TaxID=2592382 RepID=A0A859FK01_9BACI|nr:2-C-methyl-D-erythritol 4-phosphate cytidylyltransferase [Paenalkalicoccus suaedae]QKS73123.1 2-C-methyl-D-erythritol 4-phosphate cytidylyltransferase [Paenalkalicoccus suaedae]
MQAYTVVLPAAGQGKRMGAGHNKQFLLIDGVPLLIHTLRVFEGDSLCTSIILAVNEKETEEIQSLLKEYSIKKVTAVVIGGRERQQSVFEGLKAADDGIVLIHDAARPFITATIIHELVEETKRSGAAIVAVPLKDTIKLVSEDTIEKTEDRTKLWAAQTPQAFWLSDIMAAHQVAEDKGYEGTDDASILEYSGGKVKIVKGNYENFKVTTPEDLIFAEAMVASRRRGERRR